MALRVARRRASPPPFPLVALLRDVFPFALLAALSAAGGYAAAAGVASLFAEQSLWAMVAALGVKVVATAALYLLALYSSGAAIFREALQYLRQRRNSQKASA